MGIMDQMKQAMKMRSESKRIEAEYSNGGISVVARGDMTISSITIAPEAYDEVKKDKPQRFETMLFNVVNGALNKVRDATRQEMIKKLQESGAGGLFG